MIQFTSSQGVLEEYTTRLATAPQDSKRTLGYQDLTNADRLFNKNSLFSGFSTRNIRAELPRNDQWLLYCEFPSPWGEKGRLCIFLETADAKQLFDIYLNHWKRRALFAIGGFIWILGCLGNRDARLIRTKTHSMLALIREGMAIRTRALNRIIYGKWSSGYENPSQWRNNKCVGS